MSVVYYIIFLVNTITLMLDVERNHGFTSGITIPYLTYWDYAQMDICLVKSHAIV